MPAEPAPHSSSPRTKVGRKHVTGSRLRQRPRPPPWGRAKRPRSRPRRGQGQAAAGPGETQRGSRGAGDRRLRGGQKPYAETGSRPTRGSTTESRFAEHDTDHRARRARRPCNTAWHARGQGFQPRRPEKQGAEGTRPDEKVCAGPWRASRSRLPSCPPVSRRMARGSPWAPRKGQWRAGEPVRGIRAASLCRQWPARRGCIRLGEKKVIMGPRPQIASR